MKEYFDSKHDKISRIFHLGSNISTLLLDNREVSASTEYLSKLDNTSFFIKFNHLD